MKGRVGCFNRDHLCFANFPRDSFIGEVEAMQNTRRKYTVKALEKSLLLVISFDRIVEVLGPHSRYTEQLYSLGLRRDLRLKLASKRILRFQHLSAKDLFWEYTDKSDIREQPLNQQIEAYLTSKLVTFPGIDKSPPLEE
jgi:CRP-like cAMP-binding protein